MPEQVAVVARTSGDEDDGQDVDSQARQVQEDAEAAGYEVVVVYKDDGVSGSVPPLERPGFAKAVRDVRDGRVQRIVVRDWSRFSRQHPFRAGAAYLDLLAAGVPVTTTRDRPLPEHEDEDDWDMVECITGSVSFSDTYGYRHAVRKSTQHAMDDFKSGKRQTRSGKPPGRPKKVSDDEARAYYSVAIEKGLTVAARELSVEKGWKPDQDPRTQKKYRVAHNTLSTAFQRVGLAWPPEGVSESTPNGGGS